MEAHNIPQLSILPYKWPEHPLWEIENIKLCPDLLDVKKNKTNSLALKTMFIEHQNEQHSHSIAIYTDGSKSENGVGCSAVTQNRTIKNKLPSNASVFTAELYAILAILTTILPNNNNTFVIYSDSQSALKAITDYTSKHPIVMKIHNWLVHLFTKHKEVSFCWVPSHINIQGNELADKAAKEAAEAANDPIIFKQIPHKDYYAMIRSILLTDWQSNWNSVNHNKLRTVKDSIKPWTSSSNKARRIEVILTRLRIGHTLITHRHLMEGRPAPYCEDCLVPLTVEHFLVECPTYIDERRRIFNLRVGESVDVKQFLAPPYNNKFTIKNLIKYLRTIDIFDKI